MATPKTLSLLSFSLEGRMLAAGILLALGASGCCMGGSAAPPAPILPSTPVTPITAPAVVPAMQMITLAGGFAPDPTTVATVAGGPISASSMAIPGVFCGGNIGAMPNVTLTTTTPIAGLRVLVRANEDTTIMVRLSDGTMLCDDDGGGYPNPAVVGNFPAGVHQIYVGAFHMGETPPATVAFTTNPAILNAQLP